MVSSLHDFSIKNFTESNNVQNIKSKWSVHCQGFASKGHEVVRPPPSMRKTPPGQGRNNTDPHRKPGALPPALPTKA